MQQTLKNRFYIHTQHILGSSHCLHTASPLGLTIVDSYWDSRHPAENFPVVACYSACTGILGVEYSVDILSSYYGSENHSAGNLENQQLILY